MGISPMLIGTNIPSIYRTKSIIFLDQVKSINDPSEGICNRNQTLSERGMVSDVIINTISNLCIEFYFNIYRSLVMLAARKYRKIRA